MSSTSATSDLSSSIPTCVGEIYKEEELLRASTKSVPSSRGSPHSSKSTIELLGLELAQVELVHTAGTDGAA